MNYDITGKISLNISPEKMSSEQTFTARIPHNLAGQRLDQVLAEIFSDYSRSKLQTWIKAGRVQIDGRQLPAKSRLEGGETVILNAEPEAVVTVDAEEIPLDIVYEDSFLLIVNKPAGLVVHPAAGNWDGTMQNALLHYDPELATLPRAGLVHRLDKGTSGLMVVARTLTAHKHLVDELQARTIKREYLAVVQGRMTAGGTVDQPVGRHPVDRKRIAVRDGGKPAVTHFRVEERFSHHTLIRVNLETGRTHQIRVHMAHIRFPLVGDPVYGGRLRFPPGGDEKLIEVLKSFHRQALHAAKLGLVHPQSNEWMEVEAEIPEDFSELLAVIRDTNLESYKRSS